MMKGTSITHPQSIFILHNFTNNNSTTDPTSINSPPPNLDPSKTTSPDTMLSPFVFTPLSSPISPEGPQSFILSVNDSNPLSVLTNVSSIDMNVLKLNLEAFKRPMQVSIQPTKTDNEPTTPVTTSSLQFPPKASPNRTPSVSKNSKSSQTIPVSASSVTTSSSGEQSKEKVFLGPCKVCGDVASGKYFGALVCVPCKTFFLRYAGEGLSFVCKGQQNCDISISTRIQCKFCRFKKCLEAGMNRKVRPIQVEPKEGRQLCVVCSDIGNGVHFGAMTCEGCKKFFRRGLNEHKSYVCKYDKSCLINPQTRNACRYCRYNRCKRLGMSREAIQMGRPSKVLNQQQQQRQFKRTEVMECEVATALDLTTTSNNKTTNEITDSPLSNNNNNKINNNINNDNNNDVRSNNNTTNDNGSNNNNNSRNASNDDINDYDINFSGNNIDDVNNYNSNNNNSNNNNNINNNRFQLNNNVKVENIKHMNNNNNNIINNNNNNENITNNTRTNTLRNENDYTSSDNNNNDNNSTNNDTISAGFNTTSNTHPANNTHNYPSNSISNTFNNNNNNTLDSSSTTTNSSFNASSNSHPPHTSQSSAPSQDTTMQESHSDSTVSSSTLNDTPSRLFLTNSQILNTTKHLDHIATKLLRTSKGACIPYNNTSSLDRFNKFLAEGYRHQAKPDDDESKPGPEAGRKKRQSCSSPSVTSSEDNCSTESDHAVVASSTQFLLQILEQKIVQSLQVSEKYWLAPFPRDDNLMFSDARHWDIINQIFPNYDRFVQMSEKINRSLNTEFETWRMEKEKSHEMSVELLSEWIKNKVIPAFTVVSVTYCKKVPGFSTFDTSDQVKIIKFGQSPSRMLAAVLHWFEPATKNFKHFLSWRDHVPGMNDRFKQSLIKFAVRMQELQLDPIEAALLNSLIIVSTDYADLSNTKVIEALRCQVISTCRAYTTAKYGTPNDRLEKLFQNIPELRKLGLLHNEMTNTRTMMAEEFGDRLLLLLNL